MKHLNIRNQKMFAVVFTLLAFLIAGTGKSYAADVDFGELTLGQDYSYQMFKSFSGYFTAPQTGKVYIAGAMSAELFKDADNTESADNYEFVSYGPYTVSYDVTGGETYYLFGKEWDNGSVKVYMDGVGEEPLELILCTPAENTAYDLATDQYAILTLQFNHVMDVNSTWVLKYTAPDGSAKSASYSGVQANNKFVSVPVQSKLLALLRANEIKPNSLIEVCLDGLQTGSGQELEDHLNADGYTVFKFTCPTLPVSKVSQVIPSPFLSYWIPGSDSSKFEVVFDGELSTSDETQVLIQYGSTDIDDGFYSESVPYVIEGNKISADFAGTLRTPATMLPVTNLKFTTANIRLQNLRDASGQTVATGNQGSVGSFDWTVPYTLLERANVACEFTPASGSSILNKTEIELWINGLNTLRFTGFLFECEGVESVVVPVGDTTFEAGDSSDEGVYVITIPASMRGKKGVRVSLAGLQAADGYDHSTDVKAVYDSFALTFVSPADGSQMNYLNEGDIIKIEANCATANPEMCVIYEIEDLNPEDPSEAMLKSTSYMQRQDDGSYTSEVVGNYKMLLGHRYKVNFTAWATESDKNYGEESLGSDFVIWEGLTLPYKYSPIQLVSINPAPDTKLTKEDRVFTLTFDGLVTLNPATTFINIGMGMTQPFESIVAVNPVNTDDVDYSNEWILTVSESFMNSLTSALDISFKPADQEGLLVLGTNGKEEQTYFYYSYDTTNRYADATISLREDDEQPTSVSVIWASHEIGILPSNTMPVNSAYVMNKSRDIVAHVESFIIPINDLDIEEIGDMINTEVGLVLDTEINTPGAYYLVAPANYFSIGTEFTPYCSNEINWAFNVYEAQTGELPHAMDITPAPGNVTELSTIEILFIDEDEIAIGSGIVSLSINGEQVATFDAELDWDLWNKAIVTLPETYTEDGTYVISFPAGYFVLGAAGDRESSAFKLEYTIGAVASDELPHAMEIMPAPGVVAELSTVEIIFSDEEEIGIGQGIIALHINDVEHSRHDAELDWDLWNKAIINLGTTHTDAGTYKLAFPAGYFVLGSDGARTSEPFNLTYVLGTVGIESITLTTASGQVYDLSGSLRKDTNLPAGIYIIDGKKVMVK